MQYNNLFHMELLEAIGWTILHSFWQALIILLLVKCIFSFVNIKNSNLKYFIGLIALSAVLICSGISFVKEYDIAVAHKELPVNAHTNSTTPFFVDTQKPKIYQVDEQDNMLLGFLNRVSPYLSIFWVLGMLFYSLKIIIESVQLNKMRGLKSDFHSGMQSVFDELKNKMRITRNVSLIITNKALFPLTFGHFNSVILLPFEYIMQVPQDEVKMILAHELAHIKRNDFLINLVQSAFEAIYFFNPFFQNLSKMVRDEREYCCDDMAAKYAGNNEQMALALTKLNWLLHNPGLSLYANPPQTTFKYRIFRLINPRNNQLPIRKKNIFSLLILAIFIIILTNCVKASKEHLNFPASADAVEQLYTDNQAGYKIHVFGFNNEGKPNDILLISTIEGKPIYSYFNGKLLTDNQLKDLWPMINPQKTITQEQLANLPKSPGERRQLRTNELNHQIDSLTILIDMKSNNSNDINIEDLKKERAKSIDEIVQLSMDGYKQDVKNIDVDVQLHTILTDIVNGKQYTAEQRVELMKLINARNSRI